VPHSLLLRPLGTRALCLCRVRARVARLAGEWRRVFSGPSVEWSEIQVPCLPVQAYGSIRV